MRAIPDGFTEVHCQGVVSIRGPESALPVILLRDAKERTVAIPLGNLESDLIRHVLSGSEGGPQPYHNMLTCFSKLGATLREVRILFNDEFDFPTTLIIQTSSGEEIEVVVPCGDGITYAWLAQASIYIAEKLMSAIGANATHAHLGTD
jgi:bifunctional DNase/RNase